MPSKHCDRQVGLVVRRGLQHAWHTPFFFAGSFEQPFNDVNPVRDILVALWTDQLSILSCACTMRRALPGRVKNEDRARRSDCH